MTHRNSTTARLFACVGTAVLVAACSPTSPEAGRPDATSSSVPTTSASTPPDTPLPAGPPERPDAAQGLTLSAAEAFVRYYSDLMNYAADTGNTAPMLQASEAGCENCKVYAQIVKKSNAANGLLSGDYHEHVKEVSELIRRPENQLGGSAIVGVGQYISRDAASANPTTSKATTYKREVALSAQDGHWVMFELRQAVQ